MKTIIVITVFALCSISMMTLNAQQTYYINVGWNDDDCQCNEPYDGYVKVIVIDTRTNDTIINTPWTHNNVSPHLFTGSASIVWDCRCYNVIGAVYYNDGSICCQGLDAYLKQGQDLIDGTSITVFME
ncbi:MAG: hypothetical protein K0B08_12365 [Bacteroidales bacterium]|nr:hypothetical protein [Bacteroidales bacterium]